MQRLPSRSREIAFLALLLASSGSLHGQHPAATDTVWMENFWAEEDILIDGADTTDVYPMLIYRLERDAPNPGGERPRLIEGFEVARPLRFSPASDAPSDTASFWLDPMEEWRHRVAGPARLRLPDGASWAVGLAWTDSVVDENSVARGRMTRTGRSFRVTEIKDTLGARAAIVEASMQARQYRPFDPTSIVTPRLLSTEVAGGGRARYVVEVATGRVLARGGEAHAAGVAVKDSEGSIRSLGAEQRFAAFRHPVGPERAALLWRVRRFGSSETAGPDRSPAAYHRTDLRRDTVESLVVTDSGATVARTELRDGWVVRHWVERTGPFGSWAAAVAVAGAGREGDRRLVPPSDVVAWGVAEAGMEEHLLPVLRSLAPSVERQRFAIYRPFERQWDRVMIHRTRRANAETLVLVMGPDGEPLQVICYAIQSGALLFTVTRRGEHWVSRMVPREEDGMRAVRAWNWFIPSILPEVGSYSGRV